MERVVEHPRCEEHDTGVACSCLGYGKQPRDEERDTGLRSSCLVEEGRAGWVGRRGGADGAFSTCSAAVCCCSYG